MSRTPMKLILTQEVTGLGAPGDVVEVAGGYGRNYLIPRGFAMRWTRGAEKQIDLVKRARSAREIRGLADAKHVAAQLARRARRLEAGVERRAPAKASRRGSPPADHRRSARAARRASAQADRRDAAWTDRSPRRAARGRGPVARPGSRCERRGRPPPPP